jgi:hypothetical protein
MLISGGGCVKDRMESGSRVSTSALLERIREIVEERDTAGRLVLRPQELYAAGRVVAWEVYPWRRSLDGSPPAGAPTTFSLEDLSTLDGERLVTRCHHALLGRDPSPPDLAVWSTRVERGWPRLLVIASIRWSPEGRRRSVRVRGLVIAFLSACLLFPFRRLRAAWRAS